MPEFTQLRPVSSGLLSFIPYYYHEGLSYWDLYHGGEMTCRSPSLDQHLITAHVFPPHVHAPGNCPAASFETISNLWSEVLI